MLQSSHCDGSSSACHPMSQVPVAVGGGTAWLDLLDLSAWLGGATAVRDR